MTSLMGPPLLKRIYKILFVVRLHFLLTYVSSILDILRNDKNHDKNIFQLIVHLF